MRILIAACLAIAITACNSSGKKNNDGADSSVLIPSEVNVGNSIQAVILTEADLPPSIDFTGKLYKAWQWNDKKGKNILVTSVVAPYFDKPLIANEEEKSAKLYAYHFVFKESRYQEIWQMGSAERACPFDITAAFINDDIAITDLDKDGIAEQWIQFKVACRSDVSPAYMKIIMRTDTVDYELRGLMWVQTGEKDSFAVTEKDVNLEKLSRPQDEFDQLMQSFGRYESERGFAKAPAVFLEYARRRWMKHAKESFE